MANSIKRLEVIKLDDDHPRLGLGSGDLTPYNGEGIAILGPKVGYSIHMYGPNSSNDTLRNKDFQNMAFFGPREDVVFIGSELYKHVDSDPTIEAIRMDRIFNLMDWDFTSYRLSQGSGVSVARVNRVNYDINATKMSVDLSAVDPKDGFGARLVLGEFKNMAFFSGDKVLIGSNLYDAVFN